MELSKDAYLAHYGILRRSGRYPWGSGSTQNKRNRDFLDTYDEMRKQGVSDVEFCKMFSTPEHPFSTTDLRAVKRIAKNQQKAADIAFARRLKEKGWSNTKIAERMYGDPRKESSVRLLLADDAAAKADILINTADMLRRQVDAKTYLDVGAGVENYLGISQTGLNAAVAVLKEEGYRVHPLKVRQVGTGKETRLKVLCPPGTTQRQLFLDRDKVQQFAEFSDDGGHSYGKIHPPLSVNPNRVQVRYAKDGGAKEDGVIYLRPGVDDLSMGGKLYGQVRIKVGEGHYLKGMAIYRDDLPDGVDIVFNTNKDSTGNKLDAMKGLKDDPDMPFGSVIRRQILVDHNTPNERPSSACNLVNEQGDWGGWSRTLSSQVLSKQKPELAKRQLDEAYDQRKAELDDILALTNPTVKRKLLESFADEADSAAVHLKAAAINGQNWHVILPVPNLKPNEVYAPTYKDGERVALIRYPHGGTFEIPELVVNNRNRQARSIIGTDSKDAIGIHHKVAERLSGADFDGDTVLVIPNNRGDIQTSPALQGLKGFDPVRAYPAYEGMPKLRPDTKQQLMGDVSNLITDMTILGASHDELARAVRHSMVVIDAEKHNLNYRQSEKDNGIRQLKQQYQGKTNAGAATLVSRKKSWKEMPERRLARVSEGGPIDLTTGRKRYVETGRTFRDKDGNVRPKTEKVKKLDLTDDAHTLVSDARTPVERHYADYSNSMRDLAGKARLEMVKTPRLEWSQSAKKTYVDEIKEIDSFLEIASRNKPRERQAQILANAEIRAKRRANPDMDKDVRKKMEYTALANARVRTGARRHPVVLTDRQWEAIQAGAISDKKLSDLLLIADPTRIKELATPKERLLMSPSNTTRAKGMLARGFTRAEVAEQLGVSLTTLDVALGEGG